MGAFIDAVRQDVGYAIRGLRRSPGLTATIIATFAIGVGVNSAMFAVIDRVFFQAPPGVVDPGAMRRLIQHATGYGSERERTWSEFTIDDFQAFRAAVGSSAEIEGYATETNRAIGDSKLRRTVGYATTGFFHLVGVRPHHGRFFSPDENRYGAPENVAVLSYAFWRANFGGDPAVLGRKLRVDTTVFTVVGVAGRGFGGMDLDVVDVWVPLASLPVGLEGPWWTAKFNIVNLFARLDRGTNVRALGARFNIEYRASNAEFVSRDPAARVEVAPLLQARSALGLGVQNERNLALMTRLGGVALIVLVIAMSNVASLLLMRALRRSREIAVRVALGVSRGRLVGQLVVESTLLAIAGGGVALLIASWMGGLLRNKLISDVHWPSSIVDFRVVAFTAVLAIIAGVSAGLAPATIALRRDIMATLKAGSAESGRARSGLRIALLAVQSALCMMMLVSAGVFLQSVRRAADVDLGFDRDRLITFAMNGGRGLPIDETMDRIRALPTVASVTRSDFDVRGGQGAPVFFPRGDSATVYNAPMFDAVDAAYANTVGLRLLSGRLLSSEDMRGGEPVAVINREMAMAYWGNQSPIGECFSIFRRTRPCHRIVGVVGNVRWDLSGASPKFFYLPRTPADSLCCRLITVRTRAAATVTTIAAIRRILAAVPGLSTEYPPTPRLVAERHEPIVRPWRIAAMMFLAFAILALASAGAGIYGLVGYDVVQRTREFGVRIALGATSRNILRLVIGSGLRVVAFGLIAGTAGAIAAGRLIASMLFETSPYDPFVLVATAVTLSVVALLASLVPAWRATRVDPVVALRAE